MGNYFSRPAAKESPGDFSNVKTLFFDVFGTTADWRSSVPRQLEERAKWQIANYGTPKRYHRRINSKTAEDWAALAQRWRDSYYAFTASIVKDPSISYKTTDEHFCDSLRPLIAEWEFDTLFDAEEMREMSLVWHKLDPWPDSVEGLHLLNKRFQTCTLSNGSVDLLNNMAKHAGFPWTHIFSSNMFGTYKPDPKVYRGAAKKLGLKPAECGMVAAHLSDLKGAKDCGFKVIYVARSHEETWSTEEVAKAKREGWVDLWIDEDQQGFLTAAQKLGVDV